MPSAGSQNLPCASLFPSTVPPCTKEPLLGWSFCFCQAIRVSLKNQCSLTVWISHNCQDFSLQDFLTFSHSSHHVKVFLLIRNWECGLLSPLFYFTSLLEGKKTFFWLEAAERMKKKKSGAESILQFYFPSQPKVGYINDPAPPSSYIILLESCLTSKLLCIKEMKGHWNHKQKLISPPFCFCFYMAWLYPLGREPKLPKKRGLEGRFSLCSSEQVSPSKRWHLPSLL